MNCMKGTENAGFIYLDTNNGTVMEAFFCKQNENRRPDISTFIWPITLNFILRKIYLQALIGLKFRPRHFETDYSPH